MSGIRRGDYGSLEAIASKRVGDLLVRKAGLWPGDVALDIAAGTGLAGIALARAFTRCRVIATEIDPALAKRARANAAAEGCSARIDVIQADPGALPFKDERFQLTVSALTLSTLSRPKAFRAFSEAHRVTGFSGKLLVVDVNPTRSRSGIAARTDVFDRAWWNRLQDLGWGKLASQKADILQDGTVLELLLAKRFDADEEDEDDDADSQD